MNLQVHALLNAVLDRFPTKNLGQVMCALMDLAQLLETSDDKIDWLTHVKDESLIKYLNMLLTGKGTRTDHYKKYEDDILLYFRTTR